MDEPRPRLVSIKVPWAIETLDAHLALLVSETAAEPTEICFCAKALVPGATPSFEQHVVKVTFRGARAARLIPGENNMPFDPFAYDLSAVPSAEGFWKDPSGSQRRTEEEWLRTGISPDSGFYQVLPSPWMEELCLDEPELKHFLAIGRYAAAEVLAEGWQWETVEVRGPAPPWPPGVRVRD
jgi:hypothetical protein